MLMKSREIGISARFAQTAAIFIVTSVMALLLLSKASPIIWEDHFQIGQNLRSTGTLTIDGVPSILRPPGFPGFVAAGLWIGDVISVPADALSRRTAERDQRLWCPHMDYCWEPWRRRFSLGIAFQRLRRRGEHRFRCSAKSVFAGARQCRLLPFAIRCNDDRFHAGTVFVVAFPVIRADRHGGRDTVGPDLPDEAGRPGSSAFRCAVDAMSIAAKPGHQVDRIDPCRDGSDRRSICCTQLSGNRAADHNCPVRFRVLGDFHRENRA